MSDRRDKRAKRYHAGERDDLMIASLLEPMRGRALIWDRSWQKFFAIALIGALLAIATSLLSPVRVFENFLADVRVSHHSVPSEAFEQIVIVAIDDASLQQFAYTSPINRNLLASVVQRLDKLGASVIGVDVLLDRRSETAADQALQRAISQAQAPVILVSDPGRATRQALCDGRAAPAASNATLSEFTELARTAHGVICVDTLDDTVRRAPIARADHMSFAEAITQVHLGLKQTQDAWLNVPFRTGETLLWPFRTFSASQIEILPESWIKGRIVLIGRISPYSGDFVSSPLRFSAKQGPVEPRDLLPDAEIPGVVLHAFSIIGLASDLRGHHVSIWSQLPQILIGALLAVVIAAQRYRLVTTLAALASVLVLYWWLIFVLFDFSGGILLLPFTGFASALLLVSGLLFAALEREEREKRRFVQEGFSHFLSKKRVDEILASPRALERTAESRDVTILFTDLEGFTHLVDTLPPDLLAPTLNGYLDKIIDIVARHDGTVDKIVGDAVHAMFSAPLHVTDHQAKAIRCALDIQDETERYRAEINHQGIALGRTRIGISCGPALVGNFGSSKRFDYTAHGSIVNLAARLEAENKTFGTAICLSGACRVDCEGVAYREIGDVTVRGIADPVRVFEALRASAKSSEDLQAYRDAFALVEHNPLAAAERFGVLSEAAPEDRLLAYQIARAKRLASL